MNLSRMMPEEVWGLMSQSMELQAQACEEKHRTGDLSKVTALATQAFDFAQQAAATVTRKDGEMAFSIVLHHAAVMAHRVGRFGDAFLYAKDVLDGKPSNQIRTELTDLLQTPPMKAVVASGAVHMTAATGR